MKRILSIAVVLMLGCMAMMAQKPRLMIMPDKTWCNAKGYVDHIERNGKTRTSENYERAFMDEELTNVVTALNSIFTEPGREFPTISYGQATSNDEDEDALDDAYEGAETGAGVESSAFEDILAKKANAPDIYIKVGWTVNNIGLQKVLEYRLEAVDTYSSKTVAAIDGTTAPMARTTPTGIMIKTGMRDKFAEFEGKMINHFADLQQNGREITVRLRCLQGAPFNMNTEFGGEELATIINNWLSENTVGHRFSPKNASRNQVSFDQVRIPFKRANGQQNNARMFMDDLRKHLNDLGVVGENNSQGLGGGRIYLGEK